MKRSCLITAGILLLVFSVQGQLVHRRGVARPNVSQGASLTQQIGITDINLQYHRPRSFGRAVWGDLVPYNQIWRAGANENTTISFSTDVRIAGSVLEAGTYGLHVIPQEEGTWTVIFSKNHSSWGSFFYRQEEDALRVEAEGWSTTEAYPVVLGYQLEPLNQKSVMLELHWAGGGFKLKIEVDLTATVISRYETRELRNLPRFEWEGRWEAAFFCLAHQVHLEAALTWIEASIRQDKKFENLIVKADILKSLGRMNESEKIRTEALKEASPNELGAYGVRLMGVFDKPALALEAFKMNLGKYPEMIYPYTQMARAQFRLGMNEAVEKNIRLALTKAKNQADSTTVRKWAGILKVKLQ